MKLMLVAAIVAASAAVYADRAVAGPPSPPPQPATQTTPSPTTCLGEVWVSGKLTWVPAGGVIPCQDPIRSGS